MPDFARVYLENLDVPNEVKARAWDEFYASKDGADFATRFEKIPLPDDAKAHLYDTRREMFAPAPVELPAPMPGAPPLPEVPSLLTAAKEAVFGKAREQEVPAIAVAPTSTRGLGGRPQPTKPGFMDQTVPFLSEGVLGGREGGALKGAAKTIEGLASPTNVAIGAATGGLSELGGAVKLALKPLISTYFTVDMVTAAAKEFPTFRKTLETGDPAKIAEAFTHLAGTAGFALLAAKHLHEGVTEGVGEKAPLQVYDYHGTEDAPAAPPETAGPSPFQQAAIALTARKEAARAKLKTALAPKVAAEPVPEPSTSAAVPPAKEAPPASYLQKRQGETPKLDEYKRRAAEGDPDAIAQLEAIGETYQPSSAAPLKKETPESLKESVPRGTVEPEEVSAVEPPSVAVPDEKKDVVPQGMPLREDQRAADLMNAIGEGAGATYAALEAVKDQSPKHRRAFEQYRMSLPADMRGAVDQLGESAADLRAIREGGPDAEEAQHREDFRQHERDMHGGDAPDPIKPWEMDALEEDQKEQLAERKKREAKIIDVKAEPDEKPAVAKEPVPAKKAKEPKQLRVDVDVDENLQAARDKLKAKLAEVKGEPVSKGVVATVVTPNRTKARVQYGISPAEDVKTSFDPDYDKTIGYQPRQTSRVGSEQRITELQNNLDVEQLGVDRAAGRGRPLTFKNHAITGNHRVEAIKRIYKQGGKLAEDYRDYVIEHAEQAGMTAEQVSKIKNPILHAEMIDEMDRPALEKFAEEANESDVARMSPAEIATHMAKRMTPAAMAKYSPTEAGVPNPEFVREVMNELPGAEQAAMQQKDGSLNKVGEDMIRNAVFAKAYKSTAAIEALAEDPNPLIKNITAGMLKAAPKHAIMQDMIERGDAHDLDIGEHIGDAGGTIATLREKGKRVDDWLAQQSMDRDPVTHRLVEILSKESNKPNMIRDTLNHYADEAMALPSPKQEGMFGKAAPPEKLDVLNRAYERAVADAQEAAAKRKGKGEAEDVLGVKEPVAEVEAVLKQVAEEGAKSAKKGVSARRKKGEAGFLTLGGKKRAAAAAEKARAKYEEWAHRDWMEWGVRSVGSRIEREGNGAGKALMNMLNRAGHLGEIGGGQKLVHLAKANISELTKTERVRVADALEGRIKVADLKSTREREGFDAMREVLDQIAMEATGLGVQVRTKNGPQPFAAMPDYMPHIFPPEKRIMGELRANMEEHIVHIGAKKTKAEAAAFVDDWKKFLKSGKRVESLLQYMVDQGMARNKEQAFVKLKARRLNIRRHGSLENAREQDLPFYDPDPVRAVPFHVATSTKRLAQIAEFGQDHRLLNEELLKIALAGGDERFVKRSIEAITSGIRSESEAATRASAMLRSISTLKLGLSGIPNAFQPLNILLAADAPSLAYGMRAALPDWTGGKRSAGKRLAMESGAMSDSVLNEVADTAGADYDSALAPYMEKYLKAVGFTATERNNRIMAANAGKRWAERNLTWALKGKAAGAGKLAVSKGARAEKVLAKLGVNVEDAMNKGQLSGFDVLSAAKTMSDVTQFRSRPQDLSELLGGSQWGRVAFQFKNFGYQQARFMRDQIVSEMSDGTARGVGRGLRNLLILGTLYPASGKLINALRNKITGNDKEFESGLLEYLSDVAQSGAIGIVADAVTAAESDRAYEFFAGPTIAQGVDLYHLGKKVGFDDTDAKQKGAAIAKYVMSRFGSIFKRLENTDKFQEWQSGGSGWEADAADQ